MAEPGERETGAAPMVNKPRVRLLGVREAAEYLGVSRQSIQQYRRQGVIKPAQGGGIGKVIVYSTTELDKVKIRRLAERGKGKDGKDVEEELNKHLMALVDVGTSEVIKQALDAGKSDGEVQAAMRKQAAAMIVNNKLFERLAVLALHPRPDVQLKAIATLTSYVLPRLQSTEVVMKQDPGEEKFKKDMIDKMEQIRLDMQKARHIPYDTITEGDIISDAAPIPEGLLVSGQDRGAE